MIGTEQNSDSNGHDAQQKRVIAASISFRHNEFIQKLVIDSALKKRVRKAQILKQKTTQITMILWENNSYLSTLLEKSGHLNYWGWFYFNFMKN